MKGPSKIMRSTLRRGTALAILPTLGMLVLAGCGGGDADSASPGTTPSNTPTATATDLPTTPTMTPTAPKTNTPSNTADPSGEQADVTINVTVANGKVNPSGSSIKVQAGQTVLITAISDAADQLHIHGYDKELELQPGKTAQVKFTADLKGTFEIETHESGKLVAKLVVS